MKFNTGTASVGRRMLCACITGYGVGIANAAQFVPDHITSFLCWFIGLSMALFAWLFDFNRKRRAPLSQLLDEINEDNKHAD